jgi:hypothetical protein
VADYFVGDSIAEGLKGAAGGQGDTKVGRNPAQVLSTIQNGPDLTGRSVMLSTGLSNNPNDTASAAAQIAALKAKGAANISVVGLGNRFANLNPVVQQFAQSQGANFTGGFQAGGDGVHPQSYRSVLNMADNPYAPSNLAAPPARPVTPTPPAPATSTTYAPSFNIKSALVNAGMTPGDATTLTAVSGAESNFGKSPVSPPNKNGSRDYGVFQVNEKAWPQFGGSKVATLPLDQQAAIAAHIWNTQGPKAWSTYTSGAYKKFLNGADAATATAPSSPAAAVAPPSPANVGMALAALNAPTGGPGTKSTMDNLQQALGGGGGESAPPPMDLQNQQAASAIGNARQAQIAAMAPQLMAATRARGSLQGAPGMASTLSYQSGQAMPMAIPAATPGAPQPPGTTLNSTGGLYG